MRRGDAPAGGGVQEMSELEEAVSARRRRWKGAVRFGAMAILAMPGHGQEKL